MKPTFYALLMAAGTLFLTPALTHASAGRSPLTDSPAEVQRKAEARLRVAEAKKATKMMKAAHKSRKVVAKLRHAWLIVIGMEEIKKVTSPAKLTRQLHGHQKYLKARAKQAARSRRARIHE